MTIPSTTRRAGPYIGTGALVSYPFSFKTFDKADVSVVIADSLGVESELVIDSSVLVTLNVDQVASPGGSVQYAVGGVATALPSGFTLAILSSRDYEQATQLPSGGNYRAEVVEQALDSLEIQIQQLAEASGRALALSPLAGAVSATLPAPEAGKVLGWNLTEDALINLDAGGGGGGGIGLPTIAGQAGKYLSNDGTNLLWGTPPGSNNYTFTGSGEAGNDAAAFATYYAGLPIGATLYIKGKVRVTSTVTLSRRINVICPGDTDCFIVDVGTANDGVVISQGATNDELGTPTAGGINGITLALNVYGKANACKNAVRYSRLDRSRTFVKVYAGAVQYGLVVDGCLINQIEYHGSANYKPPIASPAFQADHMLVQKNTTYNVASNANRITVLMEGGRHGYTQAAQSGEGGNLVGGCIEGLTGRAFTVAASKWLHIADIWLEVNTTPSTFDACDGLRIGPGVVNFGTTDDFIFSNCRGLAIDHYYGGYFIATTCIGTTLGQIGTPDPVRNICADVSAVQYAYFNAANGLSGQAGGVGAPTMENVYANPYFDVWADNGTNAAPRGVTAGTSALVNRITGTVYPGNPNIYSMRCTASVTGIGNCCSLTLSFTPQTNEWYSALVAVYVPSGQPGVIVHLFNGTTYYELGRNTATKDGWLEMRGSCPAIAGQAISIAISGWNGTSYVAGQVYVGGCSIVRGPIAPKALADHGRRRANVISSVSNAPDFPLQGAVVGTSPPIAYLAVSNGSSTDWKQAT